MTRMRPPRRRFLVLAGFAGVVLALAAIISIAVVSQSSFTIGRVTPRQADARFDDVQQRFPDARPLLELGPADGHRSIRVHRDQLPPSPSPTTAVRGLAWRAVDGTLAEIRLPFWFVRMKLAGGRVTLGALLPEGWDVVRVSAEDLVRHGPGLLLDEQRPNGDRLLLWAE